MQLGKSGFQRREGQAAAVSMSGTRARTGAGDSAMPSERVLTQDRPCDGCHCPGRGASGAMTDRGRQRLPPECTRVQGRLCRRAAACFPQVQVLRASVSQPSPVGPVNLHEVTVRVSSSDVCAAPPCALVWSKGAARAGCDPR